MVCQLCALAGAADGVLTDPKIRGFLKGPNYGNPDGVSVLHPRSQNRDLGHPIFFLGIGF